ncbi:hypothetical protein [Pedobacter sp. B4-66]|uniref:hypothetical protein n=1 Tax=Pedobacter sp. B4-66 TaxID=2817280 RepID=UPI001BD9F0F3|nr:hypothetical protein [Pedobacter sp. B4-66]
MDILKKQQSRTSSLVDGATVQYDTVPQTNVSVENTLRSESPFISVSDQLREVIRREFEKIKANQST